MCFCSIKSHYKQIKIICSLGFIGRDLDRVFVCLSLSLIVFNRLQVNIYLFISNNNTKKKKSRRISLVMLCWILHLYIFYFSWKLVERIWQLFASEISWGLLSSVANMRWENLLLNFTFITNHRTGFITYF